MNNFTFRRVATNGCEVLDPNGVVVAWAVDELWAVLLVAALNRAVVTDK
jgi:hypothetical protein